MPQIKQWKIIGSTKWNHYFSTIKINEIYYWVHVMLSMISYCRDTIQTYCFNGTFTIDADSSELRGTLGNLLQQLTNITITAWTHLVDAWQWNPNSSSFLLQFYFSLQNFKNGNHKRFFSIMIHLQWSIFNALYLGYSFMSIMLPVWNKSIVSFILILTFFFSFITDCNIQNSKWIIKNYIEGSWESGVEGGTSTEGDGPRELEGVRLHWQTSYIYHASTVLEGESRQPLAVVQTLK